MTSQQPTQFENYPREPGDSAPATPASSVIPESTPPPVWEQPPVESPAPVLPVSTYRAPQVSAPQTTSAEPSRRGALGLFGALGVGVVVLVFASRAGTDSGTGEDDSGNYIPDDSDDSDDSGSSGETVDVGDYSADVPDGWSSKSMSGDEAVFTHGSNWVWAYAFTADDGDQAVDKLPDLVRARAKKFTLGDAEDDSGGDSQHAQLTGSGKISGKKARLNADLWIDSESSALLVIQALTGAEDSAAASDAQGIADSLSSDF